MNALTLEDAMNLYSIIGKYIPEIEDENADALEFIGKIVKNIRESDNHRAYTDAVMLMSGKDWEELKTFQSSDVLALFIEGLSENRILRLKMFCERAGFSHA